MSILKRLFCKHDWEFIRNVYGDEINQLQCRSIWRCHYCGKEKFSTHLEPPPVPVVKIEKPKEPTRVFFDTEFTGLHQSTTLISIGMVSDDGRTFYAELNDYDKTQVDGWIREHVIHNLKHRNTTAEFIATTTRGDIEMLGNREQVRNAIVDWLEPYEQVQLVSDVCHYDMVLFISLFGGAFDLPEKIAPVCVDVNQILAEYFGISDREAFYRSREEFIAEHDVEIEGEKHNALYDAKVIREMFRILW